MKETAKRSRFILMTLEEPEGLFFCLMGRNQGGDDVKRNREEVCLHYMGFGLCAKGLHAEKTGCCADCSKYQASGIKNGKSAGRK